MERSYQIRYEVLNEKYSTQELFELYSSPLISFEDELEKYPVLEIGIGEGIDTMHFASKGYHVDAIENDECIINMINKRIAAYNDLNNSKLHITVIKQTFPDLLLPNEKYSLVLLSNILHFFELQTSISAIQDLNRYLTYNSIVYIQVHSKNHPENKVMPIEKRFDHFKHYFNKEELISLFAGLDYSLLYYSEYYKRQAKSGIETAKEWYKRQMIELHGWEEGDPRITDWINKNVGEIEEECCIIIMRKN